MTKYDRQVSEYIAKRAKRMNAQMKSHTLHHFEPISIIGFLKNFKLAYDNIDVLEGAFMWLFHFFKIKTAFAVLSACLTADGRGKKQLVD